MEYTVIDRDEKIPLLGLGTWGMGGRSSPDYSHDERAIDAIKLALDLDMTHIDTAEYYGGGHAEELVGEAIQGRDREEVFITTKVWRTNLRYDDLLDSMQGSLGRLDLGYVDLYLIHWPNPNIPLKETMEALEICVEEGWTRYIGVSNFSAQLMEEAQSHLDEHKLVVDQVHYSLLHQEPRTELLPYLRDQDALLVAYRPIERGKLAGEGHDALDEMVEKYDKPHVQVAINWLVSQENVITIPKSSNPEHIREIAGSVGWELAPEDRGKLTEYFS
jgi:diketogulonate reductase-like aldo/keto reductase